MSSALSSVEAAFGGLPLALLQIWGECAYVFGFLLMLCAFGGLAPKAGARFGVVWQRQAWDARAFLSMPLTFVLVLGSGYVGSSIVLVPGAQTFESFKDLMVFLCVVLFGYPALITVPFAYGLSDLVEGVPPAFLFEWLPGYFINPACFWVAYWLFGSAADFTRRRTWLRYLCFVAIFFAIEPVLWGKICAARYTPELSYRTITPALFFTTGVTWLLAPFAMLGALPLARRLGLYWAELPNHVRERALGQDAWLWRNAAPSAGQEPVEAPRGLPIRMFFMMPSVVFAMLTIGLTAYVILRGTQQEAGEMAGKLHQVIAENIRLKLDAHFAAPSPSPDEGRELSALLRTLPISKFGRALVVTRAGTLLASSADDDAAIPAILERLEALPGGLPQLRSGMKADLTRIVAKPLSHEVWLTQAVAYHDPRGGHADWLIVTAMPESLYLAGVASGNSRTALVFVWALLAVIAIAAIQAFILAAPLQRMSNATRALAGGELSRRVPESGLDELTSLAHSFNRMAAQLQSTFEELKQSEARLRAGEYRLQVAIASAQFATWDWDVEHDELTWDDSMYRLYGVSRSDFGRAYEAWSRCLLPEDIEHATADVQAALSGEREFESEFRVRRPDGAVRVIKATGRTIRDAHGRALRMIGVNRDVTDELAAARELRQHRDHLEDLVQERTAELLVAKDQADAASRTKSAFLANISHEIRTPMNAILGFGQLMKMEPDLSVRDRERVARILVAGDHLLDLINNVLEMSKIEAGGSTLDVSTFDLHAAIAHAVSSVRGAIEQKGIRLVVEGVSSLPRVVRSDAAKLRQILDSLLGNATKFTSSGCIQLTASAQTQPGRAALRFEIQDTGAGIPEQDLLRAFEPFEQLRGGRDVIAGTGLGLPISRGFARLMGGDLTARSEVGRGTTFTFEVTVELAADGQVARQPALAEPARVVDDAMLVLTRAQVAVLGTAKLNTLRAAIQAGHVQRVPALLADVGEEHRVLVAGLSKLSRELEIEKLLALL